MKSDVPGIQAAVERGFPKTVAFLRELVQAESVLGNEEPAQRVVEARLRELGFHVRSVELDRRRLAERPESGIPLVPTDGRRIVLGTLSGDDSPAFALNGHVDVVSAEPLEDWTRPPFDAVIERDRMYGRGAGDMKGGVAAMLLAVEAARSVRAGGPPIIFQSVIEEECTGNGTLTACLEDRDIAAAVIGEPTDGAITLGAPGIIWARVTLRSPAGHAGSADQRANPIDTAYEVIRSLRELETDFNGAPEPVFRAFAKPYLLNVGALHAGDWPATTPGKAELDVRLGFPISVAPERAQERLRDAVLRVAPDALLEFRGFRAHGHALDPDNVVARLLRECHAAVHGSDPPVTVNRATSDLRFFERPIGNGAAALYGPTGGRFHAADEWVSLQSIKDAASVIALALLRFSAVGRTATAVARVRPARLRRR